MSKTFKFFGTRSFTVKKGLVTFVSSTNKISLLFMHCAAVRPHRQTNEAPPVLDVLC